MFTSIELQSRWNCSNVTIDSWIHKLSRPPDEGGCRPLVKLPSRLTISGVRGKSEKHTLNALSQQNSHAITVQPVGGLEKRPHISAIRQNVLSVEPMSGQLLYPAGERLVTLRLQVVDELLGIDVDPAPLYLRGNHRQADI